MVIISQRKYSKIKANLYKIIAKKGLRFIVVSKLAEPTKGFRVPFILVN